LSSAVHQPTSLTTRCSAQVEGHPADDVRCSQWPPPGNLGTWITSHIVISTEVSAVFVYNPIYSPQALLRAGADASREKFITHFPPALPPSRPPPSRPPARAAAQRPLPHQGQPHCARDPRARCAGPSRPPARAAAQRPLPHQGQTHCARDPRARCAGPTRPTGRGSGVGSCGGSRVGPGWVPGEGPGGGSGGGSDADPRRVLGGSRGGSRE
jgi:hypothetical protein